MKIIAHRGNLNGSEKWLENKPDQIDRCINLGYDVEIDLIYDPITTIFWLGHDSHDYKVSWKWIANRHELLWIHCKDITTLHEFSKTTTTDKYKVFVDNCGMTQSIVFIRCSCLDDANHIKMVLEHPLYVFINNLCRWGNFNNIRILQSFPIPQIDSYDEDAIYKYFNITEQEIKFINEH